MIIYRAVIKDVIVRQVLIYVYDQKYRLSTC